MLISPYADWSLKVFCDLARRKVSQGRADHNVTSPPSASKSRLERNFKSLLIGAQQEKIPASPARARCSTIYSKQIIQTYDSLHSKLQELKTSFPGPIRVATIYSIGLHRSAAYIKRS